MANKPPFAVGTVSKTQIKFPENQVTIDMSGSWDPNKKAVLTVTFYQKTGPVGTVFTPSTASHTALFGNSPVSNVKFASPGTFVLVGKVTDKGGISNEKEFTVTVLAPDIVKTKFGASGPTIDSVATLEFICGKGAPTRTATILSDYNGGGSKELERYLAADHIVFWNLDWQRPITVSGDKTGVKFPTNETEYKAKVRLALSVYKDNPKKKLIKVCCENEPTNSDMHDLSYAGAIDDYIQELRWFGQVCDELGFDWCDGGVHVDTVLGTNLDTEAEGSAGNAGKLLDAYATMPTMAAVIMHTSNARANTYDSNRVVQAVAKVLEHTGHKTWCNEYHSQFQNNTGCMLAMMQGWFDAKVEYAVYISKGGDKNDELNTSGTNLTVFGQDYKKFIDSHT